MNENVGSQINHLITLEYITTADENKYFDRKSALIKPVDLAKTICAFANAEGGTIAIGINDKSKKIEGVNFVGSDKYNLLLAAPKEYCKPMPRYREESLSVINMRTTF